MLKFLLNSKIKYLRYISAIMVSLCLHYFFYVAEVTKMVDYKFYDASRVLFENSIVDVNSSYNTVIVNIDEKSLQRVGQWPWSRNIDAQLIHKIDSMHPAVIAVNIVFSELDRTSPLSSSIPENSKEEVAWDGLSLNQKSYDELLIDAMDESRSILSVYLHERQNMPTCKESLFENLRFQYLADRIEEKSSILCNHQALQRSSNRFGFINLEADDDALLRRVSFFMNHDGVVIPSFALATLLSLDKDIAIDDSNRLHFLTHSIKMDKEMEVLLNFHSSQPKVISAIDVLESRVDPDIFKGKIVLLGLSIVGLNNIYSLSEDLKKSNIEIQATFIENVLDEVLLIQPKIYQKINILLSFLFSSLLLFFLAKRYYFAILGAFFLLIVGAFFYLMLFYFQGIYISLGYFWVSFSHYFFFIALLFIAINIREKKRFYYELQQSHAATVESISLVVAMRDGETGEHIQRTKNYVKVLAQRLYDTHFYRDILTPKFILYLYEAAPLHDIGKIGIPDAVLKKEGTFTPEEYKIMQKHPELAKVVIEKAMKFYDKNIFLEMAYNIAYYHHERWDGQGYPLGLKGDDIPLEAQLMALADVYDALLSKRCYKDEYGCDEAERIIIEGSGTAFNPILVDAFIASKEEFREIHKIWKEETL